MQRLFYSFLKLQIDVNRDVGVDVGVGVGVRRCCFVVFDFDFVFDLAFSYDLITFFISPAALFNCQLKYNISAGKKDTALFPKSATNCAVISQSTHKTMQCPFAKVGEAS